MALKPKLKPIVTYRLRGESESATRTALETRGLFDISDEPLDRGGGDEGFAPTELALGGLAACTNVVSHKIARENGFAIERMEIEIEAQFNRLGVNLMDEVAVVFPEIVMKIDLYSDADKNQLETLKRDLPKFCAVSKLFRQAGTKIREEWNLIPTKKANV